MLIEEVEALVAVEEIARVAAAGGADLRLGRHGGVAGGAHRLARGLSRRSVDPPPHAGSWSPPGPPGWTRSTARTGARSPTSTATAPSAGSSARWATPASGRSTPARSSRPTRRSRPPPEEVAHARRVLAATEEAAAEGRGAISLDGVLVDAVDIRLAEAVLGLHERIG